MYVLYSLKFLGYTSILLTINFQETEADQKGPGKSACNIIPILGDCEAKSFDDFPAGCTSFIFSYLSLEKDHTVTFTADNNPSNAQLEKLGQSGKDVFVNIGRQNYSQWIEILDYEGTTAKKEAYEIKSFISGYSGITGIIIRNFEPSPYEIKEFAGFTETVLKYIETVRQTTGKGVALHFYADTIQEYYDKQPMPWLNFTVIDPCVDFYVFSLVTFVNECSRTSNGLIARSGNVAYTLEKLKISIGKSLIPQDKIYYTILLTPNSGETSCVVNYQTLCECPDKAKDWCSETQETLFKNGQWFRENGAGFIGAYFEFDDPHNSCKCGPHPSFNAVLAGFNGTASIPPCALFDRSG